MLCSSPPDSPADIGEVALKVAQDEANNGCIMEVWSAKDYKYRKRVVVDQDGKSNPIFAEEPLVPQLMKGKLWSALAASWLPARASGPLAVRGCTCIYYCTAPWARHFSRGIALYKSYHYYYYYYYYYY